jgi:hypothetical protein
MQLLLEALVLGVSLVTSFTHAQRRLENGLWISDGYGLLVEVTNDKLRTFQLTSISCLPGWSAQRNNRGGSKELIFVGYDTISSLEWLFRRGEAAAFGRHGFRYHLAQDRRPAGNVHPDCRQFTAGKLCRILADF